MGCFGELHQLARDYIIARALNSRSDRHGRIMSKKAAASPTNRWPIILSRPCWDFWRRLYRRRLAPPLPHPIARDKNPFKRANCERTRHLAARLVFGLLSARARTHTWGPFDSVNSLKMRLRSSRGRGKPILIEGLGCAHQELRCNLSFTSKRRKRVLSDLCFYIICPIFSCNRDSIFRDLQGNKESKVKGSIEPYCRKHGISSSINWRLIKYGQEHNLKVMEHCSLQRLQNNIN